MPSSPGDESGIAVADVAVSCAGDAGSAALSALAMLGNQAPTLDGAILLLPPPPVSRALRAAARSLAGSEAVTARPLGQFGELRSGGTDWREVAVPVGAQRFDRVRVPAHLLDRRRLLALALPAGRGSHTPMSLLSQFAHSRQRLAARFGGDPGAIAELAAPLRPDLVLLAGRYAGQDLAVVTGDLIAAELVAQALLVERSLAADVAGPWEHAVVQRAADLDLGVRLPSAIRFHADGEAAQSFLASVGPRIGVG